MHILLPETDNCPSWISRRERMTIENISWSISTKECCRPRWGLNPRIPGRQLDGSSNWATEAGTLFKSYQDDGDNEGDNERLSAKKHHSVVSWIPPSVEFKPRTSKSEVTSASIYVSVWNIFCSVFMVPDVRGYLVNNFPISPKKHTLWVLIRSASVRHF